MPYLFLLIGCFGLGMSSIGINTPLIQQFDSSTVVWMSLHRSDILSAIAISLSYLGGLPVTLLISGIWCLLQIRSKKYSNVLFICLGVLGGSAIGWILKYAVDRPRPDSIYQMVQTYGASFPSAHSIYAAILAGLVMFIFYKHTQAKVISLLACLWFLSMGVSRVYLGAHFPTDVIAGWSIGLIWIALLWLVLKQFILGTNKLFLDKNLNEVE